jgi:hypothetical protein
MTAASPEILDHVQLTAVDPPGEYHEQQPKRLKWWGHCSAVYRLTNHRASSSGRLAHYPIASISGHYGVTRVLVETEIIEHATFAHKLRFTNSVVSVWI